MDKANIGITSANGWEFLSYKERFALYQKLGFRSIMFWWGGGDKESRKEKVALANEYNLHIENVHALTLQKPGRGNVPPNGSRIVGMSLGRIE